jgi:hypothetical protein
MLLAQKLNLGSHLACNAPGGEGNRCTGTVLYCTWSHELPVNRLSDRTAEVNYAVGTYCSLEMPFMGYNQCS